MHENKIKNDAKKYIFHMNKIIVTTLILVMAAVMTPAWASKTSVSMKGDTTTVIEDGDTTRLVGGINIGKIIERVLDDTIVTPGDASAADDDAATPAVEREAERHEARTRQAMAQSMVQNIVGYCVTGAIIIIFFSLLFYYLHRKAKYRMMEKAIENNYPLPGTPMAENHLGNMPPAPQPQPQPQEQSQPQQQPVVGQQPMAGGMPNLGFRDVQPYLDWVSFKRSFILIAVGVALMLFFAAAGTIEMVALMSILVLIGAAQSIINYQQQKQLIVRQLWQQQQQQQAQQAPQPPVTPQQPPVFHPNDENTNPNA